MFYDSMMTDAEKAIQAEVRAFVRDDVSPDLIRAMDKDEIEYPREYVEKLAARNLLGLRFDPRWGGRGLSWTAEVIAEEEIGVLGTALGCAFVMPSIVGEALHVFGTEAQKEKFLKPILQGQLICAEALTEPRGGSDFFGATTTAALKDDHFIVNGQKRFVVGATEADVFLVYCRTNFDENAHKYERISALLIERAEEEAQTKEADDSSSVAASRSAPAPEQSIAVLPFANMSGNVENEYFADGLSEEILNFLADIPDLRVTARTSSFQFKGRNVDVREVAGALNVAHVLEGSVRRSGERARITAQLIRAEDGYHLWSEAYDRTLEDTFQVQIEIAESVTRALGVVMDDRQRERMHDVGVRDVESFIHFQRGRKLFYESHSNNIDMAILAEAANEFTRAIELEPRFATAYHMRSDHAAHIMTMAGVADTERTAAAARQSDDLAQAIRYASNPHVKALVEVDRTLSSSDWSSARDRLEAALASPTCDEGTWIEVAPVFGYAEQTLARARRLIDCDPLNFYNYSLSVAALLWSKQGQAANEIAARGLEVAPENPFLQSDTVDALAQLGRLDEALALARSSESAMHEARMARILAARGEADAAREWIAKVVVKAGPWLGPFVGLQLAAVVGDRDTANETAAWYDGLPGGPLMLAGVVLECACGAPFDIEVTPRFAERLAEAGVDWPPPTIIDFPLMREATGQD